MINIQTSSKLNPLIDFNRQVNSKKKKKEKIIQLSALSIRHSYKQKKSNILDSRKQPKKNQIESQNETLPLALVKKKKINDIDIINGFKQLASSTWSFNRSNNLLNATITTTTATTTLPSPTLSSASSSDVSLDLDSHSILAFPMPPPPRSNVNTEFNRQTSLPSTPLHNIPFTPNGLRRFPSTSQLHQLSRPSIPISEAFDPTQPPKLPLPPLPSNSSQPTLSFGFPSIPLRSSSLNSKASQILHVHKHQPILPISSVRQPGIFGGLAIDTSHANMPWSIHKRDAYCTKTEDHSVIISAIESQTNQPDSDNLTPTHETCKQDRTIDHQDEQVDPQAGRGIVGSRPISSSHQEELKKLADLDTMDCSLLSEELFIDSAGGDDLKVTPRPTDQHEDDDDLLTSSYDSINWPDDVMLPDEEELIKSVENPAAASQSLQGDESDMSILDQSFSEATSSYISSHKATSSDASQLTPNSSAELDTLSQVKRSSPKSSSNKRFSTFSVGDLSEWIKQHRGSLVLEPGQIQSDDDESEIDLEESFDRLAKRLGYQGEFADDSLSHPISSQHLSSPSSPSNLLGTELDDDYDRDDLFSTVEDPIISSPENKVILSLAFSPTFNAESSGTRSDGRTRSSSSTCSFTTNSTASILTPVTPIDHKPFHHLPHKPPQSTLRHQFSLSKLDLGRANRPILEHKRSSLSLAAQCNSHSKFKPAYRPQTMKVIEEPSSSDEEEFDLSLDHPRRSAHLPSPLPFASQLPSTKSPLSTVLGSPTTSLFSTLPRPSSSIRKPLTTNLVQPQSRHGTFRKRSGTIHESKTEHVEEPTTHSAFGFARTAIPRSTLPKTMLKAPKVQLSTPNLRSSIPKPSFTKTVNSQLPSPNAQSESSTKASSSFSSSLIKPKISQDQVSSGEIEHRLPSLSSSVGRSIPSRMPVHLLHSKPLAERESQQPSTLSQPSYSQIDEKPASSVSPSLASTVAQPESNPSPLSVTPPPGKPGSLERRQWLSGGRSRASDEPSNLESHDSEGKRPASISTTESSGQVSISEPSRPASLGTIEPSLVVSPSRASSVNQQLSPSMTTDDTQKMSSKWCRNMNLQSESIFEAPEEEGQIEELTSTSMASETSTPERKLRLKPLFLGSSASPVDQMAACEPTLRHARSRASLPPSANRLSLSNNSPLTSPYLSRRSSLGFSPNRPTSVSAGFNSNLFVNEKPSSPSSPGERSPNLSSHSGASASISIRQLTYN